MSDSNYERVSIENATAEQMVSFAEEQELKIPDLTLGKVAAWENSPEKRQKQEASVVRALREILESAGYSKYIFAPAPPPLESMLKADEQEGAGGIVFDPTGHFDAKTERWVRIMVSKDTGIPSDIPINLNGANIRIRTDEYVWVRERFVRVLVEAEADVFADPDGTKMLKLKDRKTANRFRVSIGGLGGLCHLGPPPSKLTKGDRVILPASSPSAA